MAGGAIEGREAAAGVVGVVGVGADDQQLERLVRHDSSAEERRLAV
jgi:hypothetical protein